MSVSAREVIEEELRRSEDRLRDIGATAPDRAAIFDRAAFLDRLLGDADAAAGRAHTIKGAAVNVGAMALSATAAEVEKAARAGRRDDVIALLPELVRQFGRAHDQMRVDAA